MKFIEPFLSDAATAKTPLIVCGDINDGPGLTPASAVCSAAASSG
jgi:hypothetical protein